MPDELDADSTTLAGVAAALRGGGNTVEGGASAPAPAQAGTCTAAVAGAMAVLCESLGAVSEGMGAAAGAVEQSRDVYTETDHGHAVRLGRLSTPN